MPNDSCRTLAMGARQLVVHDAFEMMWCFAGSYLSSFTPRTMGTSGALAGGGRMGVVAAGRLGGCGVDGLLRAVGDVLGGGVPAREESGALEHDIDAQVLPRKLRGILH